MSRESGAGPERNGNGGGMSGNTGRGSGGSSSGGKGGGRNDSGGASSKGASKSSSSSSKNDKMGGKQSSSQSTGYSSMGGASSYGMDKGSFANSIGANNEGKQAGKGGGKNDSGTVSQRVKSITSAAQAIASRPAYTQAGYGDTINAQRQQLAGPTSSGASSAGTAASYGMTEDQFNQTIGTDNFNGTINNLEGKLARGTASETDKASIGQAASDYNNLRGAGILGRIAGGSLGKSAAQTIAGYAMGEPSDYLSGQARLAASGDLDTGRLTGQRGEVGDGSWKDSALSGVMSILGLAAPGASMLASGAAAAVTDGAPGFGGLLNNMANQAGYGQTGDSKGGGSSGDNRNTATSQTATPGQAESTLDRYDPTKYQFKGGTRAATAWSYN